MDHSHEAADRKHGDALMGKQPWPLMKHCKECGFYHGVNYDCTADPKAGEAVKFDDIDGVKKALKSQLQDAFDDVFLNGTPSAGGEPKGIFSDDLTIPPPAPILPQPLASLGGALYIEGPDGKPIKIGELTGLDIGLAGGLLAAVKAKLTAAPTAEVADAFFLAFVEHSRQTPVRIAGGIPALQSRLTVHFGGT